METGEVFNTTSDGYLEIDIPVGQNVTFTSLDYNGFHATQTATVQVPDEGLNTLSTMMVLQVPSNWIYDLLEWLVPGKKKTDSGKLVRKRLKGHGEIRTIQQCFQRRLQ